MGLLGRVSLWDNEVALPNLHFTVGHVERANSIGSSTDRVDRRKSGKSMCHGGIVR